MRRGLTCMGKKRKPLGSVGVTKGYTVAGQLLLDQMLKETNDADL